MTGAGSRGKKKGTLRYLVTDYSCGNSRGRCIPARVLQNWEETGEDLLVRGSFLAFASRRHSDTGISDQLFGCP